ncbi:HHR161Cp [Eremothecium sinecaudum]|uniref:HHR161Cp n=1 Tax=Eremothecium sinecaudum TaxID=45286 RepID=A0A0X8HWU8_9SACH|nr:HHR161Cp [Eremothecium sinecaudum]AMD22930.1 HHR161Cp [Eremothecium sinecaudum]
MSKHSINIPGAILDELKSVDYSDDSRFKTTNTTKKKGGSKSRKERRKLQRLEKKAKHSGKQDAPFKKFQKPVNKSIARDEVIKPTGKENGKRSGTLPPSSDDELSSDDFEGFDDDDLNEEEWEQLRELETEDDGSSSEANDISSEENQSSSEEEMTVEKTMAKLKALKEKKKAAQASKSAVKKSQKVVSDDANEEEFHGFDDSGSEKKTKESRKRKADSEASYLLTPSERAAMERDEKDMKHYAKVLGLKGKKKKLRATDEYDAIGGLLEGLEFFENYGSDNSAVEVDSDVDDGSPSESDAGSGDSESDKSEDIGSSDEEENVENPFSSDDELSSDDFDEFGSEDLDDEELEQLRELEGEKEPKKRVKENPYVAPSSSQAYVPPLLRNKRSEGEDAAVVELQKKIRSSLNKLTESNIPVIVSSINELFDSNARKTVAEIVNSQIIELVSQKTRLLDSFVMNFASVAYSLWKLRGLEIGASFIQVLVQSFIEQYNNQMEHTKTNSDVKVQLIPKQCSNLLTLLSYAYDFGMTSSRILYDIIKLLIQTPNEFSMELILRIVSVSGPLIRGDDPMALKEIMATLLPMVKDIEQTPRMKFLLETMYDLKNNKLKPSILAPSHHNLKKSLSNALRNSAPTSNEPLQVSLDDIINVETKGKWWLVGASWKGNMENAFDEAKPKTNDSKKPSEVRIVDGFLDEIPDWDEIARKLRMNTDTRRAIFISIVSAQDYMEAFTKLEKLNLKNKQTQEIPKVLLHCLANDGVNNGYNPYYSVLGAKLCENNHNILKSFQFLFWDVIKKFEADGDSDNEDELFDDARDQSIDARLKKIAVVASFFGYLLGMGKLKLDVFKHVSLLGGLNSDGLLFVEQLFCQMFLTVARQSEQVTKVSGKKQFIYKDDYMKDLVCKGIHSDNKETILKSFKWFISKKFKYRDHIIKGDNIKDYERKIRRLDWAVSRFIQLTDEATDL